VIDGLHYYLFLNCLFQYWHEIGFGCNDLQIIFMIVVLGYAHIIRRSRL